MQKMSEKEAIMYLKSIKDTMCVSLTQQQAKKSIDIAIQALEEIQQYKAIGTLDQCREAVERMKPKKPIKEDSGCYDYDFDYKCPTCGEYIDDTADATCCGKCGQAIDWSE